MRTRPRLYYYPYAAGFKSTNPYAERQLRGLAEHFEVVNRSAPTSVGIIDIYRRMLRFDVLFCNWIENTPDKRFGLLQSLALYVFLHLKTLLGIKVVWVLHNKVSHTRTNRRLKVLLVETLFRQADLILTHSTEGVAFAEATVPQAAGKVHFLHHPVPAYAPGGVAEPNPTYDILIWGAMHPYKGVREFLETLAARDALARYRILIWGKFPGQAYFEDCRRYASDRIEIRNGFLSDEERSQAHRNARIVLFTYLTDSVLSSGALMDSLNSATRIVGPDSGAFRDLAQEGHIDVYKNLDDVVETLDRVLHCKKTTGEIISRREGFFEQNSWTKTSHAISDIISRKFFATSGADNGHPARRPDPAGQR